MCTKNCVQLLLHLLRLYFAHTLEFNFFKNALRYTRMSEFVIVAFVGLDGLT